GPFPDQHLYLLADFCRQSLDSRLGLGQSQRVREARELPRSSHQMLRTHGRRSIQCVTKIEEAAEGGRRVEVIVHGFDEPCPVLSKFSRQLACRTCERRRVNPLPQPLLRTPKGLKRACSLVGPLLGPLDRVTVVRAEHPEPERIGRMAFDERADSERVPERL